MNNDIDHLSIPTTITSEYKTGKDNNNINNDNLSFFSEKSLIKILSLIPGPKLSTKKVNNNHHNIIKPIPGQTKKTHKHVKMSKTYKNSYTNRCFSSNNSKTKLLIKQQQTVSNPLSNTRNDRPVTAKTSLNHKVSKKLIKSSNNVFHTNHNKTNNIHSDIHNKKRNFSNNNTNSNTATTSNNKIHTRIISTASSAYNSPEINLAKTKPRFIVNTISAKEFPTTSTIVNLNTNSNVQSANNIHHNSNKIIPTCANYCNYPVQTEENKTPKRAQFLSYQQIFMKKIGNLKNPSKYINKPSYTSYTYYKTNTNPIDTTVKAENQKQHSAQKVKHKEPIRLNNVCKNSVKKIPFVNKHNGNNTTTNKSANYLGIVSIQKILRNKLHDLYI